MSEIPVKTYVYFVSFFIHYRTIIGESPFRNGFVTTLKPINSPKMIEEIEAKIQGDFPADISIISFQLIEPEEEKAG